MSGGYEDDYNDEPGGRGEDYRGDDRPDTAIANRTSAPGIFLIICGSLNLIFAVLQLGSLVLTAAQPASTYVANQERFLDIIAENLPQLKDQFEEEKKTLEAAPEDAKKKAIIQAGIGTAILFVTGILPLLAGIRMRALQSYGLAVTGSIAAAIPCLSPAACPCGIGLIFGIWALVVLLNPEVRQGFR